MAAATTSLPTLSQLQTMDTTYLREAAAYWTRTANLWENVFTEIHDQMSTPAGTRWHGQAATAALEHSYDDMVKVRGASDQLREAAATARRGDEQLLACRAAVLDAVRDARGEGFETGEDYLGTDRAQGGSTAFRAARQAQAQGHTSFIRHRVASLVATDQQLTTRIAAATESISDLTFHEAPSHTIIGDDKRDPVQAVDHTWENDPAPTPGLGPNTGPSADDIRRVLEKLPDGSNPRITEVRSPEDLERLWQWLAQEGVERPGAYGPDPSKGVWKDLPDGSGVGRRNVAKSTEDPAIDVKIPGEQGNWKVHINPQRGGVPDIPAPIRPAPPEAQSARAPGESPPIARPPAEPVRPALEPVPRPAEPDPVGGGLIGGGPLPGLHLIHPPHTRHGRLIIGEDPDEIFEENK
jgi:hypothetical protein